MTDSSKPNDMADDLDLEDGEIESDNDEAEIAIVVEKNVTPKNVATNTVVNTIKNPFAQNPKNDVTATVSPLHKARDVVKDKAVDG